MELLKQELLIGNEKMPCYCVRPASGGPYPALVVLAAVYGLTTHIRGFAERFAAEGFVALSPNLYFRLPDQQVAAYDNLSGALALLSQLNDDQIVSDVSAAIDYLKSCDDVNGKVGLTGFCTGGRICLMTTCRNVQVSAAAPFYASPVTVSFPGQRPLLSYVSGLKAPVLITYGDSDVHIPMNQIEQLRTEISRSGAPAEYLIYPGADHAFMNPEQSAYNPAAAKDAFPKVVKFLKKHLS